MKITQILIDQKEELLESLNKQSIVEREQATYFATLLGSKLIKVMIGIRRCGKSVSCYKLLAGQPFAYVNFDDDRLIQVNSEEIVPALHEIWGNDLPVVFFDEIQNLENWELLVNRLQRQGVNVLLTGSNSNLLSQELSSHLTGRNLPMKLFPFSFREFLAARNVRPQAITTKEKTVLKKLMNEYIYSGGFPEIVVNQEEPKEYLRQLYSNIIERDIIIRHNIKYKKTFKELAMHLLSNSGRLTSYRRLKNLFNLGSDHSAKNYLLFLEESFLIRTIGKFSFKASAIERSEKKVYVIDTGFIEHVSFKSNPEAGLLYETVVALQLLRERARNPELEIYYYKNQSGFEVDFLVKRQHQIACLIQVAKDLDLPDTTNREVRSLLYAARELKCDNLLIINDRLEKIEETSWHGMTGNIKYIPLDRWLLEPEM